jgi:hypothetical protein
MTKMYKTARGKSLDVDKIKLVNESTVAVGNMRVNARGDKIGNGNKVVETRNQIMDKVYAVEEAPYSPNDPQTFAKQQAIMEATNAKQFNDLAKNLSVPITEPATAETPAAPTARPAARGNLASSVAKSADVVQEALPNPKDVKKAAGPSRI